MAVAASLARRAADLVLCCAWFDRRRSVLLNPLAYEKKCATIKVSFVLYPFSIPPLAVHPPRQGPLAVIEKKEGNLSITAGCLIQRSPFLTILSFRLLAIIWHV